MMTERKESARQTRIAFIGSSVDTNSFTKSANLEARRLPPQLAPKDQIKTAAIDYLVEKSKSDKEKQQRLEPYYCIITENQEQFLTEAKNLLNEAKEESPILSKKNVREFYGILNLVNLNATTHSDTRDTETGIRVIKLLKGETAHPVHPTPNS